MSGRHKGFALVAVAGMALLGCGDDGDDNDNDDDLGGDDVATTVEDASASGGGSGDRYEGELADGSTLVIRLDVPADDPAVAPFEEFRALTGVDEPTWIVGEVTVPDGVDGTGRFVTFLEAGADRLDDDPADRTDGITNADFACAVIEDWFQAAPEQDQALGDAYVEVYEGPCAGQGYQVLAPGGETTTYVLVYEGELPDFETIEAELGNTLDLA